MNFKFFCCNILGGVCTRLKREREILCTDAKVGRRIQLAMTHVIDIRLG